jgi:hypothetical protein
VQPSSGAEVKLNWEAEVLTCGQFEPTVYLKAPIGYGVLAGWQEGNTEEPTYLERNLSQCHFVRRKTRVDLAEYVIETWNGLSVNANPY